MLAPQVLGVVAGMALGAAMESAAAPRQSTTIVCVHGSGTYPGSNRELGWQTRFRMKRRYGLLVLTLSLLSQGTARASELELYETGAPALGTASAGHAAIAADASTAASNTAGLTLLGQTPLIATAGVLAPMTNFNVPPETTTKAAATPESPFLSALSSLLIKRFVTSGWDSQPIQTLGFSPIRQ